MRASTASITVWGASRWIKCPIPAIAKRSEGIAKPQNKVIEKERSACSSASLSHSGIFLGDKCYWNPATLRNGHAVVLGTSGSGKINV